MERGTLHLDEGEDWRQEGQVEPTLLLATVIDVQEEQLLQECVYTFGFAFGDVSR